jgi:hypothetical protein
MDVSISEDDVQAIHGRKQHADADLVCIRTPFAPFVLFRAFRDPPSITHQMLPSPPKGAHPDSEMF